jgi:hypothetical protein
MAEEFINLKDPDTGEIGSLPVSQAHEALSQGFTQAAPEEVQQFFKEQKYGSVPQQIATGLEGAAESATFGLSTAAETALGVPGADITARREVNPGSHTIGQLGGLGIGMLTGSGEAAALEGAGSLAAKVGAALPEKFALNKIGSTAARLATENALFQSGDEVSKMFAGDPHQTIGTAMAEVGLSGLIGGGTGGVFGAVSPLWKATFGNKVNELLGAFKNKSGGIEGQLSQPVREALDQSGVEIAPEIKAALSDDPHVQMAAKTLEQSDTTKSGLAYQESLHAAKNQLSESMVSSLGKDSSQIEKMGDLSKYEAGKSIGDTLASEIHEKVSPLAKEFEELKGKVGNVELPPDTAIETPKTVVDPQDLTGVPRVEIEKTQVPGVMSQVGENIAQLAVKEGWTVADDTPISNLVQFVQKNLGKQKSLKDLSNFISRVGEKAESLSSLTDRSPTRAGGMIKSILKDAEANVIESKLGEQGSELVDRFKNVRTAWKEASGLIDQVQEQIGVRASTSGYAKAVREMAQQDGESLLRRIAGSGNAAGLKMLQENFPKAAEQFRAFHLDSLLKQAADKAKPGQLINPKALINGIEKLSPEMRSFVLPAGAAEKIKAVGTLMEQFERAPHNFSNTARTMDKLFQHVPGGAVAVAGALAGHPIVGALLAPLAKLVAKDAPDALRLSMLKMVGSTQPIESGAFKAMVDVARATLRGEASVTRATRAVLKVGGKGNYKDVSENDRRKLDKQLLALQLDPSPLMNVGGDIGHYLPDHAAAIGETAANAVGYLNSLRPNVDKQMPLDAKLPPDPVKQAAFDRALTIAEQPLVVLENVKEGTVVPQDLVTLQNVAPGLYSRMREKLNTEMIGHLSEDEQIPYKTRLGISMFLGQPLDSTMTPSGIMAAQPKPMMQPHPGVKPTATGMQKLAKMGAETATPGQQRQMSRVKHIS